MQGIKGEGWIEFEAQELTDEELLLEETDPNSLHKPIRKKGQEDVDRTDNTNIQKNVSSSTNINHDVPNITRQQQRYQGG